MNPSCKKLLNTVVVGFSLQALATTSLQSETFTLTTAGIQDIQDAMAAGALTAEKLIELSIARIEAYDQTGPEIKAVLTLNEEALETARALDEEYKTSGPRSPLHGIPVLAKDVFDTYDMPTTGGYSPLKDVTPARDSTIVARLRDAGAIILAKVNQSDWYTRPEMVASSTLGGNTKNPFALDRTPGWSSSGTSGGLAARFGTVGLGSETGFSIRTPTSDGNLFGLSTTSGLISRAGQMWSYITGERGGPMARSVYDVCVTLDAIAGFDSEDLWTANSLGKMPLEPYVSFIDPNGLEGARVGVLAEAWDFTPVDEQVIDLAKASIEVFKENGAYVFDPVSLGLDLPDYLSANPSPSRFERIAAINQYLIRQGPDYPYKNAEELLLSHQDLPIRDSDVRAMEDPIDLDRDLAYRATLRGKETLRQAVLDLMDKYDLDALIYPHKLHGPLKLGPRNDPEREYTPNQLSPVTGLPAFIVPMGLTEDGLPVGLEILGRPWSEPTLIKLASGFEAVTDNVKVPSATPSLPGETISY
ncbi:amidase family protein [Pelagicoccus sp. SDUM812003]|uniref:amidase n=1 Tax=Pelagicoccus sp. SDUM812003 TaxID=3041267 RepID=UPI00280DCF96|nr:amidase family protein [Pelagicoccus sp. SDUM812003]MDQ8204687.1 amidase family protein [Pelagicoccus sp. SDUM812003]